MPVETRADLSRKLKICVLHGYLLTGTGSNIFVNNLVRSICRQGHDVYLFCQENNPESIDFVYKYCVFMEDNQKYETVFTKETPFAGKCFLFNPHLKGLLPVFVLDRYKGFEVKTFMKMDISEIEDHICQNVQAIETVFRENNFDVIQANHVIISPFIARKLWEKYKVPYYITLHGSALNFVVKKDSRMIPYANSALLDASKIFAVSNHNRLEALDFFEIIAPEIEEKLVVIPAGVDTDLFNILEGSKQDSIEKLKSIMKERVKLLPNGKKIEQKRDFLAELEQTYSVAEVDKLVSIYNEKYEQSHPDQDIVEMLDQIDWERDRVVLFVGKYMWTKGIQLVIGALPFILKYIPNLQILLVGFGNYREELEALVHSIDAGRRELFSYLMEKSLKQPDSDDSSVSLSSTQIIRITKPLKFLDALAKRKKVKDYFEVASDRKLSQHVHFMGALGHNDMSNLLPCADGFVAASIFPEAFGMVSIEALACGVLPIVSNQTGFKEIVDLISETVDAGQGNPRVEINEDMLFNIAANIIQNIVMIDLQGPRLKEDLRQLTLDNFSWDSIAERYISFYELENP
jgi:glycosyltransferase involved in cell wall biosynthesis